MLADVFSSLDGCHWSLWVLPLAVLLFFLKEGWASQSWNSILVLPLLDTMSGQAQRTRGSLLGGSEQTLVTLFLLLLALNLAGLVPYVFSVTSHLLVTLTLGLLGWLALILSSLSHDVKSFFAHLAPAGAPSGLVPFLVLVETLSSLIRPLTLSVRLAANMSAGHLIMGLVGSYLSATSSVLVFQMVYSVFEMGVCIVQSYVFALLLTLYSDEHP